MPYICHSGAARLANDGAVADRYDGPAETGRPAPGIGHAGVESLLMLNPSEDITTSCACALESLGRDA